MPTNKLIKQASALGIGYGPNYAGIYIDTDDNKLKFNPDGTERVVLDASNSITTVQLADGTAAAPSLTFDSDLDSGIYRIGANNIGVALGGAIEFNLTTAALSPGASDGSALGTTSLMWSDLFLASGGVVNFNNGNVTLTHTTGVLTLAGALTIGVDGTGYDTTLYGDTSGCSLLWDQSEDQLVVTQTNAATTGVEMAMAVNQTHTGVGGSAEAFKATLTSAVQVAGAGGWANAICGKIDFSTAGYASGLAGVVCAELDMPGGAVPGGAGTYAAWETEINLPTSYVGGGVPLDVMVINVWGAEKAQFDSAGYLLDITGVTSGSGDFWYANKSVPFDAYLKIRINGTPYYLGVLAQQAAAS